MRPTAVVLLVVASGCTTTVVSAGSNTTTDDAPRSLTLRPVLSEATDDTTPAEIADRDVVAIDGDDLPTAVDTAGRSASTSVETTSTTIASPRRLTMAFTGDTLTHSPLWAGAQRHAAAAGRDGYDFVPMLASLRRLLEPVDLAVCHLETPIAPVGEALSTAPRYGVPEEIVDAIAASGHDRCSTASNHTLDRGTIGVDRTIEVLESRGLGQSGMARDPTEITPTVFDVSGVAVSHLSYTFSYNGLLPPAGQEWRSALIDPGRILADAAEARARGAEVVIVSLHWGNERQHAVTGDQRAIAETITAAGTIDLVVGHHAHVVQPIEEVNGTWIVYGLGNIISNLPTSSSWPAASQDAMVVTVAMSVGGDGTVEVERPLAHPTWVDRNATWTVRDVLAELGRTDLDGGLRSELERSLSRTAAVVGEFLP